MTDPRPLPADATDRALDALLGAVRDADDPAAAVGRVLAEADTTDGLIWDELTAPLSAVAAESTRPVPADVAQRHLAAMHASLPSPRPTTRFAAWKRRLAATTAAFTTFAAMGGGAVAVAQEAAPGDALYGVKRASESVALVLERSPQGDAALHLEFAQRRLAELQQAPEAADELLPAALEHLDEAETNGSPETQEAAKAVGQGAIEALTRLLEGGLPETASDQARASLQRNLERKQAHQEAKEAGGTGKDQAPGQAKKDSDDAPGSGRDQAPGQSKRDETPAGDAGDQGTGQAEDRGAPATEKADERATGGADDDADDAGDA